MPIPACTQPVTITEENWTTQARQVIISYLDENGILWIFYETMPCPATERNRYNAMKQEAQHVDEIENLSDVIFPVDEGSKDKSQEAYMAHRFSLDDDMNLMEWWSTLLKLQSQKAALGISDSTRGNALKDAESTIRSKIKGTTFAEFIKWQTEVNATEKTKTEKGYNEARIQHFEIRFRDWQKILDAVEVGSTGTAARFLGGTGGRAGRKTWTELLL